MSHSTLVEAAFESAPVGLVLSERRIIKACNQTFCELSGYARNELISQSFRILYENVESYESVRDIGLTSLSSRAGYVDQRLLKRKDGTPVWCRFRAKTLTPDDPLARTVLSYARLERPSDLALTPRESDVVKALSQGNTSKQIATELGLSPRTVEDVRARLLKKFDVKNAAEMLAKFRNVEL